MKIRKEEENYRCPYCNMACNNDSEDGVCDVCKEFLDKED